MTGPEHNAEAERLIGMTVAVSPGYGPLIQTPPEPDAVAKAQVHATLALAAATALCQPGSEHLELGPEPDQERAWLKATGEWKS